MDDLNSRAKGGFVCDEAAKEHLRRRRTGGEHHLSNGSGPSTFEVEQAGPSSPSLHVSQSSVSRPWVSLGNPTEIRAFVSDASEEELYEMAALVQADNVENQGWATVQERIVLAVFAYEGLWRKLSLAGASMERRRLSLPEPEFWTGTRP